MLGVMAFPDDDLAALAAAHGVAVSYEGSDRSPVDVDPDVVVAVLSELGVDASTPESVASALDAVRSTRSPVPGTVAVVQGQARDLGVHGRIELEDGTTLDVDGTLPADLPLGWHRLVTDDRDEVTVVVAPARLPEVPRTWGWMLQLSLIHI